MSSASYGVFIPQAYYTFVSSAVAALCAFGVAGTLWYVAKLTRNILLHTSLSISTVTTYKRLFATGRRPNWVQILLLALGILNLFTTQIDVLLNLFAPLYTSVGQITEYTNAFVPSLGPLSYLNVGALSTVSDSTNNPTFGVIAALFKQSLYLGGNDKCTTSSCSTFQIDLSCDLTSNVLLNAPSAIAATGYATVPTIFNDNIWNIPQDDTMVSIPWAMGPTVSPVIHATTSNQMVLAQVTTATNGSVPYANTTSINWFPIVGSKSKGASYIWSEGNRGRQSVEVLDPSLTYFDPGAVANDTLSVKLVEIVDITFGATSFTHGPAIACFTYWYLDGQDAKCVVNLRRDLVKQTETYDVIVLVESLPGTAGPDMAPFSNMYPAGSLIRLINNNPPSVTVQYAQLCSALFYVDAPLCRNAYSSYNPADTNLIDTQMFFNFSYSYTVVMKSHTLQYYNNQSQNVNLTTSMVSGFQALPNDCTLASGNGLFFASASIPKGSLAVLITWGLMTLIIILFLFGLVFFWYNDLYLLSLRYLGQDFDGLSGDVILDGSWIGVVKRKGVWQVEVVTRHHQEDEGLRVVVCGSFHEADMMLKTLQKEENVNLQGQDNVKAIWSANPVVNNLPVVGVPHYAPPPPQMTQQNDSNAIYRHDPNAPPLPAHHPHPHQPNLGGGPIGSTNSLQDNSNSNAHLNYNPGPAYHPGPNYH